MKTLLSTFYSDDEVRIAQVFITDEDYMVSAIDSYLNVDKVFRFKDRLQAEDFAEDWVMC